MALETPNVAHAAGVAVATIETEEIFTFALSGGQGFSGVRFVEVDGELEIEGQLWTLNRELNVREAVVMAGSQIGPSELAIVGEPPTPFVELDEDFTVEPNEVLTIMPVVGATDLPFTCWCVVYAVPANGEAA